MTRTLLALLLILGQFPLAAAPRRRAVQHPSRAVVPVALEAAARQAAEAAMATGIPAVQIAVSHGGHVVYSEAFGVTDKKTATPATSRSVMAVGSITKQFTAAGILRLAERGALSLDDRIEKFVPEFDPRGRTITLRHLLGHRSGVPNAWAKSWNVDRVVPVTREQVIKEINAQPFDFLPDSKWSYSNAGFMLLGYAIESITGTSYADFVHTEFVLPLGLIETYQCGTYDLPLPKGYGLYTPPPGSPPGENVFQTNVVHPSHWQASGSLCSTASDLARWSHLLASGSVLLPASYATMTARPPAPRIPYGFGVELNDLLGRPAVSHAGGIDGFLSFLVYFPERDIAVAVNTNANPAPTLHSQVIALAVAEAALASL
jgi:D-alanyl-D-alanine carboxypeptidase